VKQSRWSTANTRCRGPERPLRSMRDRRVSADAFEPVFRNLPRDCVAMQTEHLGGIPDVSLRPLQGAGNEHLLELTPRVVVEDPLSQKFLHEPLELIAHGQASSRPDSNRNASMYLSRVRRTTSSGNEGTGGCLFQRICSR